MLSRRHPLLAAVIFSILLALATGCHRSLPVDPAEVRVGIEGNPASLDPRVAQDAYSTRILPLVFEGLFKLDQDARPVPDLVESYSQPDPLTLSMRLQRGRLTPSGRELTAHDAAAALDSLRDATLRSPRRQLRERIKSITVPDGFTIILRLTEPYAPLLTDLTMGIPVIESQGDDATLAGTGPYSVAEYEPGSVVRLTANPRYHGPPPSLARIEFRVMPDDVTRVLALERGEIHLLQNNVPPDDVPIVRENPRLDLIMRPGINYSYLGMNLTDPTLKDRRVREAIALAIDRETIARCLLHDTVTLADTLLAPGHWAREDAITRVGYDPARARALLDEAGYPDPDGDGPLPRFRLNYKTSQNKLRRWMAEAIANQLGEVGVEVEVTSSEWGAFFADIVSGNFQIYSLTWVGVTDPDIYHLAFHSSNFPPAGANRNRYSNPEVDRLAELGRREPNPAARAETYRRIQRILAEDLVYISLWYGNDILALDKRLKGVEFYPGGDYRSLARARWEL